MVRYTLLALASLSLACVAPIQGGDEPEEDVGTAAEEIEIQPYAASGTNYAQDPTNSSNTPVYLTAGTYVMFGTCGVTGGYVNYGDTYLRLYNPFGSQVAVNDNGSAWGCGAGSLLSYYVPASGTYTLRAGCWANNACQGMVAKSETKAMQPFSASNTNYGTVNTFNKQYFFSGGDTVRISTCGNNAYGAWASGDTYLRLYQGNTNIAVSDNIAGCGAASEIIYPIQSSGFYQVRAGCYANTSCTGAFAVYVE